MCRPLPFRLHVQVFSSGGTGCRNILSVCLLTVWGSARALSPLSSRFLFVCPTLCVRQSLSRKVQGSRSRVQFNVSTTPKVSCHKHKQQYFSSVPRPHDLNANFHCEVGPLGHEVEKSRQKAATADTKAHLHFSSRVLHQNDLHSTSRRQRQMCLRDRSRAMNDALCQAWNRASRASSTARNPAVIFFAFLLRSTSVLTILFQQKSTTRGILVFEGGPSRI